MNNRKTYFDILRITAIYLAVLIHTGTGGYLYYLRLSQPPGRAIFMGATAFIQAASVPMLMMISGALLLSREESIRTVARKRILRFALLIVLFSLISYAYTVVREKETFSLWVFLCNLFSYEQVYSYWYLYAYLAFLVELPFLRIMVKHMRKQDFLYFFAFAAVYSALTPAALLILKAPLAPSSNFSPFIVQDMVLFPIAGYCIDHCLTDTDFSRKRVWIAAAASAAAIVAEVLVQTVYRRLCAEGTYNPDLYLSSLSFFPCVGIFFCAKAASLRAHVKGGKMSGRLLSLFSSCSLGVYLLQHIILAETKPAGSFFRKALGVFPGTLVWVLLACITGTLVTWLLKKVPGMRKLL